MSEENNNNNNNNEKENNILPKTSAGSRRIRKIIIHTCINILLPLLLIIILAVVILGIFSAVGDTVGDLLSGITDFFTVDESDGSIDIKDDDIDKIINAIADEGINPADLHLLGDIEGGANPDSPEYQEALRTYIRKFYEAQVVTETLNYFHRESTEDETYGAIYVYRATSENAEENRKQLTYIPYEQMQQYDEEDNVLALDHFSVNEETGQLVIAGTVQVIVETGSEEGNLREQSNVTIVNLVEVDYKTAVAQYTTRLEVLLYLTMISQNPEFVSAVTDLIKDSRIELTIMDNISVNESTFTYDYVLHTRTKHEITDENGNTHVYFSESSRDVTEITKTTTITTTPSANITYVKTWFCEQEIKYQRVTDEPIVDEPIITHLPDEAPPAEEGSWKTDQTETLENQTTNTNYREVYREEVQLDVGKRGDAERYANGEIDEPTFVGLMETEFEIPNSTRTAEAGTNLVSGAEMLFFLLQKDPELENMEMILRYALNQYTNTDDYGTDFDNLTDSLDANMLQVGTDYIVDTTRSESRLVITDAEVLRKAIEATYSGETRINLVNEVDSFLEMQETYNVNAVFAVAVTIIESSGGTNWAAIAPFTHNWMSVTGEYNGQSYHNPDSSNPLVWRVYPDYREATLDFGNLIANSDFYFQAGKYTVDTIAPVYCNTYWGSKVSSEMTKIYNAAGIEITTASTVSDTGIVVGGITTQEQANSLETLIETEFLNTKIHSNGEYQDGPFAKWWNAPYNALEPFQCTWWANGRASMYLEETYGTGKRYPTQYGNGGDYYALNVENGWFEYGSAPRANSLVSWSSGEYGHVAYVEGVTSDGIYISHAGNGEAWYGVQKIPLDGTLGSLGRPDGYIYLDSPKNWEE